jgi:hypothetical protein
MNKPKFSIREILERFELEDEEERKEKEEKKKQKKLATQKKKTNKEPLKKVGNVQIPMSLKTTSTPKKKKVTTDFKEGEKVYEIEGVMTNTDKTKPVLHSELTNYNKKNDPKVNRAIKKSLLGFTKEDLLKKHNIVV